MISFEFHLEKRHEKTQKPLWFLGFPNRYLFRFAMLVAEAGLEPTICYDNISFQWNVAADHSVIPVCGARQRRRATKCARRSPTAALTAPSLLPPLAAVGLVTQRATLAGLITRRSFESFFITKKEHHPIGWCSFLVAEAGLEPTTSGL